MKTLTMFVALGLSIVISACQHQVPSAPQANANLEKSTLVTLASNEGIQRLKEASSLVDYVPLSNHFESQTNKMFCGPTTVAIVLNSLRSEKLKSGAMSVPQDPTLLDQNSRDALKKAIGLPTDYNPTFNRYTQNNIFWGKDGSQLKSKSKIDVMGKVIVNPKKPEEKISDFGLQLHQLNEIFVQQGTITSMKIVNDKTDLKTIRNDFIENLSRAQDRIVVNYKRSALGQKGSGHISPVGAYHHASDSVLVLDVNPNSADWVWIKLETLVSAMNTFDTIENRGYLLISDGSL